MSLLGNLLAVAVFSTLVACLCTLMVGCTSAAMRRLTRHDEPEPEATEVIDWTD